MKEMSYENKRNIASVILDKGEYKNYEYIILSLHIHPCAYICLTPKSIFYGKRYDDIPVDCHGGLTFSHNELRNFLDYSEKYKCDVKTSIKDKWVIGWDYAHCDDYSAITGFGGKMWTTQEIKEEVEYVIEQLITLENTYLNKENTK